MLRKFPIALRWAALPLLLLSTAPGFALEKISYGLNWVPEGEHCGFFQAKAKGYYEAAGLDVTLRAGNPNVNMPMLVATGTVTMGMGSSFTTLNLRQQGVAVKTVAAFFQKDPQTLVAHPDQGVSTLQDLKGKPIMVGQFSRTEFWAFLKAKYGFSDDQLRPYAYNAAPFLADPKAVQQGYITEDAMMLGKEMPKPPVTILLADYGYDNYATTVFTTDDYIKTHAPTIQAFIDASRRGYEECLHGDNVPGMKAMLSLSPEHGEPLFHFKIKQMRDLGMVENADTQKLGLGAMTDARWKSFFDTMVQAGVYPKDMDYKAAYTLQFVDKK